MKRLHWWVRKSAARKQNKNKTVFQITTVFRRQFSEMVPVLSQIVKARSHITPTLAFSFGLCCPVLENENVKCKHHHLLPCSPFVTFDANRDVTCEQGSIRITLRILVLLVLIGEPLMIFPTMRIN